MLNALLVAAVMISATAEVKINKSGWTNTANLATATAINSAVWTGWIPVPSSRSLVLEVTYVQNAGTAVVMACETHNDASTTAGSGFELHVLSDSATTGTSTSTSHTWSNAVSGNELWTWTVANLPHDYVNCSFTATSGDGSDTAVVRWRRVHP
jgi:hypothetical protein